MPAGLDLEAGLVRITLGTTPALVALPRLDLFARLGSMFGPRLVDTTTPQVVRVQLLRTGFALDEGRKPVFLLAALGVQVGARSYPFLDLTDTDALADPGGTVVDSFLSSLLGKLGAAEVPVRVLAGLSPPPGPRWPMKLVSAVEFLSDPPAAVAGYHARVLSMNRALYPQLGALLAPSGGASEAVAAPPTAASISWPAAVSCRRAVRRRSR